MSEQTCKVEMGNKIVLEVHFDYEKPDHANGIGAEAVIDKVILLNEGGYPRDDIIDWLSQECLDRLQEECFKCMDNNNGN